MIIGLTGHTKGFGKHVSDYLIKEGHTIVGFSRSNGYNISLHKSRLNIIDDIRSCDVFINNTYCDDGQWHLLKMAYDEYPLKHIISIGADITETDGLRFKSLYDNKTRLKNLSEKLGTEYKSWGFWKDHPVAKAYPYIITNITIEEAIEELLESVHIH